MLNLTYSGWWTVMWNLQKSPGGIAWTSCVPTATSPLSITLPRWITSLSVKPNGKNETNILYVQFPWFIQRQKSWIKWLDQVFVMWICNISFKVLVHVSYSFSSNLYDFLSYMEHKKETFSMIFWLLFLMQLQWLRTGAFRLQKRHKSTIKFSLK